MKKSIFAVAVLTSFCGVVLADNESLVSSIDIYQIAGTKELNTNLGSGKYLITQDGGSSANHTNLVQGDVTDNNITINQIGTGHVANVVVNASMPGNNIFNGAIGGDQINTVNIGSFSDFTLAEKISGTATNNSIDLSQSANNAVANLSILGSNNNVGLVQSGEGTKANISIDGEGNSILASQFASNSVLNIASHGNNILYNISQ